ncbi:hypothetical protein PVAP13_1NG564500 [Panicum virgatum]|uniref:CRIB domain-containing protein n=2 Tax=Panicum virgatum TaxID=38727 RepID=A0A8T0XBR1_PANVG|nr:hypothetical protein PVAP13_1NG564500 [Panicum virgatum]
MKGLLKGLRYISQIFDAKEPEMQIGNPTDVKHVAHIGWDNNSVTAPSWMNEFKASPGTARGNEPEPSQAGCGGEEHHGGGEAGGKAERPRRTRGKGSGGGEPKRREGAGEGSRRDRRVAKTDAEGSEGDAAAPKQRRRKPRAPGGGTSGGRSKSSSGGAGGCGPTSDSEAARSAAPEAEDDRDGC